MRWNRSRGPNSLNMIDDENSPFRDAENLHLYSDNVMSIMLEMKLANHSSGFALNSSMMTVKEFIDLCTPECYGRYRIFCNYIRTISLNPMLLLEDILRILFPILGQIFLIRLICDYVINNDRKKCLKYREKDIKSFVIHSADDSIVINRSGDDYLEWNIYFPSLLGIIRDRFDRWKLPDYVIYFAISRWYADNEFLPHGFNEGLCQNTECINKHDHAKKIGNMRTFVELLLDKYNFIRPEYAEKRLKSIEDFESMEIFIYDILCKIDLHMEENKKIMTMKGGLKIIRLSIAAKAFSKMGNQKTLEGWFEGVNKTYMKNLGTLKP